MSFQSNSILMPRDYMSLTNGERDHENTSKVEQKRARQWFMDTPEQELFCRKKQAVESANDKEMPGVENMRMSLWSNTSSSRSIGQFTDCLLGPSPVRTYDLSNENVLNGERKDSEGQLRSNPSVCLSMSGNVENPLCLNTGVRNEKANAVCNLENAFCEPVQNAYNPGERNKLISKLFHGTGNSMPAGLAYNSRDSSTISLDATLSKTNGNLTWMGGTFSKRDGNFMLMDHPSDRVSYSALSISQGFNQKNYGLISADEKYDKGIRNLMSVSPASQKGHENLLAMTPAYSKANERFTPTGPVYTTGDAGTLVRANDKSDDTLISWRSAYNNVKSSIPSMGQNSYRDKGNTIPCQSFEDGPQQVDPAGSILSSYELLTNKSSGQPSEALGLKDSVEQLGAKVTAAPPTKTDAGPKNKEKKTTKKASPNNFPANVKSLLSTGILDGVPVKYVSWSREKTLRGLIKRTAYLCGCEKCKLSKSVNAYEFERHANCKTKHPNNHIYFENGKTIYAVVQELKNTPQDKLFDAIQTVTGSQVNQKNFLIWKASFQAATAELQRIYGAEGEDGKAEVNLGA